MVVMFPLNESIFVMFVPSRPLDLELVQPTDGLWLCENSEPSLLEDPQLSNLPLLVGAVSQPILVPAMTICLAGEPGSLGLQCRPIENLLGCERGKYTHTFK